MEHSYFNCLYTSDFSENPVIGQPYQSIEILMTVFEAAVMDQLYISGGVMAKEVTDESKFCDLIPETVIIVQFVMLFNLCRYLKNGMKLGGIYCTANVSPQPTVSLALKQT